ncbi:hypothetical protein [Candidatus Cyanaurora vandensis]|uniref:hypothetical protein n=1 Tax=Candidatus Cyanaurora vandensis TaxID=2714958 RepID=UPI00257D4291|nr:hypothetical protein [Candidatus Cyanaurora vandensis]
MDIQTFVDHILADKVITRAEQAEFDQLVTADGQISNKEREQIQRVVALIESGEVKIVE